MSERVIASFNWYEPVTVTLDDVPDTTLKANLTVYTSNGFYYGGNSNAPAVGDTRITFAAVEPDTISIIAQVKKGTTSSNSNSNYLDTYTTSRDGSLLLVKRGTFTSEELFIQADAENTTLAWILRIFGFLIMFVSVLLVLQPLATTAVDIIPFIGDCMQGGLESCIFPTIAAIISIPVSLFVISMAWVAYRPYIAIPILGVCFVLIVCLCIRVRKAKQDDDENNSDCSIEDIKPKPDPYSSSATPDVASGGEGFGSALGQLAPSAPYAEPDIKL